MGESLIKGMIVRVTMAIGVELVVSCGVLVVVPVVLWLPVVAIASPIVASATVSASSIPGVATASSAGVPVHLEVFLRLFVLVLGKGLVFASSSQCLDVLVLVQLVFQCCYQLCLVLVCHSVTGVLLRLGEASFCFCCFCGIHSCSRSALQSTGLVAVALVKLVLVLVVVGVEDLVISHVAPKIFFSCYLRIQDSSIDIEGRSW